MAAGLLAVSVAASVIVHGYLDLEALAQERVVEFSATVKGIPDLTELNRQADLVVVGRIVGDGRTRMLSEPGGAVPTASKGRGTDEGGAAGGETRAKGHGTPITLYTLEVERVVRGTITQGSHVTLAQLGGKVSLPTFPGGPELKRDVQFEHDTLMNAGERQVLFLRRAEGTTYYVVGGAQGRLAVDGAGNLHSIGHGSPAIGGREQKSLESLITEVQAAR